LFKLRIRRDLTRLVYIILEYMESVFGSFFVVKLMPIRMKNPDVPLIAHEKVGSEFAILMQGPLVHKNDFTLETLAYYRSIFPNVRLVLSTWDSECNIACKKIEKLGVDIVISEVPEVRGISNVNLQLQSTIAGLNYLSHGTKYILKTRTDHRIYSSENWLKYLRNKCETSISKIGLEKKLIICNLNMYRSRKYVVSDMFMFGRAEDISAFWNITHQVADQNLNSDYDCFGFHGAETYIMRQFLKSVGWNILTDKVDSEKFLSSYFSLVDKDVIGLFWLKYNHFYDRKYKTVDGGRSDIMSVIDIG
jgi:hypothetical protein